jgi:hypothetical protein
MRALIPWEATVQEKEEAEIIRDLAIFLKAWET